MTFSARPGAVLALILCLASCMGDGPTNSGAQVATQPSAVSPFAQCATFAPDDFVSHTALAPVNLSAQSQLMLRFIHMSDTHITDDDGQFTNGASVIDPAYPSAQRLHEEYSDEILNNMIGHMNACHAQYPIEFMLATGDITDLGTIAETRRFIDNMDGTFDGPSAFEMACRQNLPEGAPEELVRSLCQRPTGLGVADTESTMPDIDNPTYQFQVSRTVLQLINTETAAATGRWADGSTDPSRQTLTQAPGLPQPLRCDAGQGDCPNTQMQIPWMAAFGNHDGYIRGTVAGGFGFNEASLATGRHFIIQQNEFIDEFFFTQPFPGPIGHGFNFADDHRRNDDNVRNDGYYAFDAGNDRLRMIVLNTMFDGIDDRLGTDLVRNPTAVASGWLDADQFAWLQAELEQAYAQRQLVMVFSHHPDTSFATGAELLLPANVSPATVDAELASWPHVLAWVAGHTHQHKIRAFTVSDGLGSNGSIDTPVLCKVEGACRGFWQIETASLLDHPQEQRLIEVYDNGDGTGTIRAPVFGHTLTEFQDLARIDRGCTLFPTGSDDVTNAITALSQGSACLGGGVTEGNPADRNVNLGFVMPWSTD